MGDPFSSQGFYAFTSDCEPSYENDCQSVVPQSRTSTRDLDMYLADLYEGIDAKIRATGVLFTLVTRTEWLESLATHSSAMGAIARVLREEGRKSFQLRFNILSICSMFSLFHKFHETLSEHKIGKTTLNMVALEVQRSEWQSKERLLYMSVHLLLNIAEDPSVEKKMKKYNLVENLCKLLKKKNAALLCITVMFLKKLSVFQENKEVMKDCGIIYKLAGLLPCKHEALLFAVLRLLWNLSFDEDMKKDMVKCELIQILGRLMKDKRLEQLVYGVLYNISTDIKCRIKIVNTDLVSNVIQIMTIQPRRSISEVLMALSINLTAVPRTSEVHCKPKDLEQLIMRAIQDNDPLLVKVLRNMSRHDNIKVQLVDFIPALIHLLLRTNNCINLQVEILGLLNNIASLRGSFDSVLTETSLVEFLLSRIKLGHMEDDMLLEIVIFIGELCSTGNSLLISQSGLVQRLSCVFLENRYDTELLLQLLYTFGQFLMSGSTSKALFDENLKVMVRIVDLSQDYNMEVAKLAEVLVNTVCEINDEWCKQIIDLRFRRLAIGRFEDDF